MKFDKNTPCKSCPYRTDAPLRLWNRQHFIDLLTYEKDLIGATYQCHCNDSSVCRGWLIDQWNRDLPSNALRMSLSKFNVSRAYLDSLHSPVPLYESVATMCLANFPDIELPPETDAETFWNRFFADHSEESTEPTDPPCARLPDINHAADQIEPL